MSFSILFLLSFLLSSCNRQSIPESTSISLTTPSSASHTVSATTTKDNSNINFAYQNSQISFDIPIQNPVVTRQDDSSVTFASVKKDIEFHYKTLANGLKEEIILNQPSTTNQFTSRIKITNSDIYQTTDNTLIFYDSSTQKYLYHFQKPFAIDSKGVRTNDVTYQLYQNDKLLTQPPPKNQVSTNFSDKYLQLGTGSDFTLLITVDSSWLSDPDRSYPITIDPTIITDEYTSTTYINAGVSYNYQVTGGQLKIAAASNCWATSGTCDSNCTHGNYVTDPYNDYYTTYIDSTVCSGLTGNEYLDTASCNIDGTGICYTEGQLLNCYCDANGGLCFNYIIGWNVHAPGAACSYIASSYYTSATVQSTNLLVGSTNVGTIDSFQYNYPSMPGGTSIGVKFSQNASTWYSSTGGIGASNALTVGTNSINLSALNWAGSNFYYQLNFLSTGTNTPTLNSASVSYSPPASFQFEGLKMEGLQIN